MFGFKIIRESEYHALITAYAQQSVASEEREISERRLKDIDSLREQNGKLRQEINRLSQSVEIPMETKLKDYSILRAESYPCDNCKLEKMDCKKLVFADSTICVCHKDEKTKFTNSLKPKKK